MQNGLPLKLIIVADLHSLRVYEATGVKVKGQIDGLSLSLHKEHRHEQGVYKPGNRISLMPGSAFEPHSPEKDLERLETAKLMADHLDKMITENSKYNNAELFVIAEPKLLGCLKQQFSKNLQKLISKTIPKDLAHHKLQDVERSVFG